jgi:uncharacterized protein (TIGR02996 family)
MARKRSSPVNEASLLRAVLNAPEDDAPRLAFADWFAAHGQPERAEFIRLQIERARLPLGTARITPGERERALLAAHGPQWLAALPVHVRPHVSFERGFPGRADCDVVEFGNWDEAIWQLAPITALRLFDSDAGDGRYGPPEERDRHLRAIAAMPQLAHIRTLDLREGGYTPPDLRILLASPHLTGVRDLTISDVGWGDEIDDHPDDSVGDEVVRILVCEFNFPALTVLNLEANGITDEGARELASSLLLARVTNLCLGNSRIGNAGVERLAASPHVRQLAALHLYCNDIGDRGAHALAESPNLARLRELSLMVNSIGPAGQAALRARFGEDVTF